MSDEFATTGWFHLCTSSLRKHVVIATMYQSLQVYDSAFEVHVKAHALASEDVRHSGIKRDTKARTFIASISHFRNYYGETGSSQGLLDRLVEEWKLQR